ncbi:MAG: biotin synthase [Rubrivivax sp.]|nr:MAG: biotin synthase [Rubrivivax sp.]
MAAKLDVIRLQPLQWLDWGGFLGAGATEVQTRYPQAQRWVAEPLSELAERSREQWRAQTPRAWWAPWRRDIDPVCLDGALAEAPWAGQGVQMVWANMALHAHPDLPQLLRQWHQALAVDGFLMCSGLGPDTARELRELYRALGWPCPTIDFIDMHDLGDALVEAGFADPVMDMERITLTWAHAEDLLAELRTWGGNVAWGRHKGWRTPRWRVHLLDALTQALGRPDGRLGMTVELVYGHAVKPAPRPKLAPETRVSLDDMKAMIRHGTPRT